MWPVDILFGYRIHTADDCEKVKTDVSRWFGGTMTKQSDTEHNNPPPVNSEVPL
jgi:hypothetical protein